MDDAAAPIASLGAADLGRPNGQAAGAPVRSRRGWLPVLALVVLLGVGVHALLAQLATADAAAGVLRRLRPWPIVAAVLALAGSYLAGGYTAHTLARLTGDRLSVRTGTRLVLGASGMGLLGGSVGFFAAKYYWGRALGLGRDGALLCAWAPAVLNTAVLLALAAVGLGELAVRRLHGGWRVAVPLLLLAITAVVALRAARAIRAGLGAERAPRRAGPARRWPWARASRVADGILGAAIAHAAEVRRRHVPGVGRRLLAGAVGAIGLDALALAALFVAAGERVAPGTVVAGYALPQVLGAASLLPGGLGVVEGGMVGVFVALDVPMASAVIVVLAYRALAFWLPTIAGLPVALLLQRAARIERKRVDGPAVQLG